MNPVSLRPSPCLWLCPFLYLATTMGSILNGLGKTTTTFLQNITALVLRLAFVLIGIPQFGIMAYLRGMLASELLLAFLHLTSLKRLIPLPWNAMEMIVKPAAFLIISIGVYYAVFSLWDGFDRLGLFVSTALHIGVLCMCYGGFWVCFIWQNGNRFYLLKKLYSNTSNS